jgi:hypothetical protein
MHGVFDGIIRAAIVSAAGGDLHLVTGQEVNGNTAGFLAGVIGDRNGLSMFFI